MEVKDIPIPAQATIKVTKEGKQAVFDTTVIQTTDNKYIYCMPIRRSNKLVNFDVAGMTREVKIQVTSGELYLWKNIAIMKFVEDGKPYIRIKTTTPGTKSVSSQDRAKQEKRTRVTE